jgi:carbon storage regulator
VSSLSTLTVKRKAGEAIRIGDDVRVIVRKSSRGVVSLSIEAPREVRVLREELLPVPAKGGAPCDPPSSA